MAAADKQARRFGIEDKSRARRPGMESKTTYRAIEFPRKEAASQVRYAGTCPKNIGIVMFYSLRCWPLRPAAAGNCTPVGRRGALVAMPAELDAEQTSIPNFGQRRDDRRKIDFALAEHQVLVDPGPHVLDVDIGQPAGRPADFGRNWQLSLAVEVADVDRQPQPGRVHAAGGQLGEQRS